MVDESKRARVICFSNHKGGVGKTCSVCNVGAGLARRGKKVLLIDLDPQANLSLSLGLKDAVDQNIYHILRGEKGIQEVVFNVAENLDLVASSLDLAGAEIELSAETGREYILRDELEPVLDKYDYVLIDCAPSLGLLTTNAFTASAEVFIPLQAQYLSLQGIGKLTKIIDKIKQRINKRLEIGGILITQYDKRKVLNRDISDEIESHFGTKVFRTRISDNISLAEAPGRGQDIFRYNPKCKGAEDYSELCAEILSRHE
jgi:chromosome partitioning protein